MGLLTKKGWKPGRFTDDGECPVKGHCPCVTDQGPCCYCNLTQGAFIA